MTASSVSSCFIAKTSQGYTHCAYFSKYSDLALIYHHKQAEYSCDRFVIFPPSRFHTSSAAPIADSLWELETRFFFLSPLSPSLWLWVSSAKWIFHLTLQKWWLGMERRGVGCLPCTPSNVRVQSVGRSERSVGSHQTDSVASNPRGLRVCVCPLCSQTSSSIWQ